MARTYSCVRRLLTALLPLTLSGCFLLSTRVYNVGLVEQYGLAYPDRCNAAELQESPVKAIYQDSRFYPYYDSGRSDASWPLGEYLACPSKSSDGYPIMLVNMDGVSREFHIVTPAGRDHARVELSRSYHTPRGQAAQLLQVLALPADVVIGAGEMGVGTALLPVIIPSGIYDSHRKKRETAALQLAFQSPGPYGIAVDTVGTIYVADAKKHVIYRRTADGVLSTLAGTPGVRGSEDGACSVATFFAPHGLALDPAGTMQVADTGSSTIRRISSDCRVSTVAGTAGARGSANGHGLTVQFDMPQGVAVDSHGNSWIADTSNNIIRKITPDGLVSTLAGSAGRSGHKDGKGADARFLRPTGIAVDRAGTVYVTDSLNYTIRRITPDGLTTTLAGEAGVAGSSDGKGAAAHFLLPSGVAVNPAGEVYVADTANGTIRRISPEGAVTTLAGAAGQIGHADGVGATARFDRPTALAVDGSGNVYVVGEADNAVRKISPAGTVSTLAMTPEGSAGGH